MPDDDLLRKVYCVLGMPIDLIGMPSVLRDIAAAAASKMPFFISTPNLNFLVNFQSDPDIRESLLESDLCPVDGMPVVWIARLVGIPIKNRIAGSDIFDALKAVHSSARPLKVFLFGGSEGVAAAACRALNARPSGLYCVGAYYPGFGSVDGMSRDDIIDKVNSSDADFLVVSLGAKKGQMWLQRNYSRLLVPVRAHLGAVINFQAAKVRRAPPILRKFSLEWLWRIKEEPYLWRRYWNDGSVLVRLLFTRVLPLALWTWWLQVKYQRDGQDLDITQVDDDESVTLSLSGSATARHVDKMIPAFRKAIVTRKRVIIDFSNTRGVDARFLGLLLMLRKKLKASNADPKCVGLSRELKTIFHLNRLEFLLGDKGI
jgi:N-acetylglucosaminyldiphosphoundecaprenol N-acetyl-beta-D-mannosaminyltransferase